MQPASYTAAPTPTFTIGPETTPTSIVIGKGETENASVILTSVNGFSGTVSISATLTPTVQHPPTISLSAGSVTLGNGDFAIIVLAASAKNNTTEASYTVTINAAAGSQNGSVQIPLYVVAG